MSQTRQTGPASPRLSPSVLQILPHGASGCSAGGKLRQGAQKRPALGQTGARTASAPPARQGDGYAAWRDEGNPPRTDQREAARAAPRGRPTATAGRAAPRPRPPCSYPPLPPDSSPGHGDGTHPTRRPVQATLLKAPSKGRESLSQSSRLDGEGHREVLATSSFKGMTRRNRFGDDRRQASSPAGHQEPARPHPHPRARPEDSQRSQKSKNIHYRGRRELQIDILIPRL